MYTIVKNLPHWKDFSSILNNIRLELEHFFSCTINLLSSFIVTGWANTILLRTIKLMMVSTLNWVILAMNLYFLFYLTKDETDCQNITNWCLNLLDLRMSSLYHACFRYFNWSFKQTNASFVTTSTCIDCRDFFTSRKSETWNQGFSIPNCLQAVFQ